MEILRASILCLRERQRLGMPGGVCLVPKRQRDCSALEYFDRSTGPMGLHQSLFFVLHRPRRFSFSCEKKRRGVDTVLSSFPCAQEKKKWGARFVFPQAKMLVTAHSRRGRQRPYQSRRWCGVKEKVFPNGVLFVQKTRRFRRHFAKKPSFYKRCNAKFSTFFASWWKTSEVSSAPWGAG